MSDESDDEPLNLEEIIKKAKANQPPAGKVVEQSLKFQKGSDGKPQAAPQQ